MCTVSINHKYEKIYQLTVKEGWPATSALELLKCLSFARENGRTAQTNLRRALVERGVTRSAGIYAFVVEGIILARSRWVDPSAFQLDSQSLE
jgi:hypothetical protein